MAYLEANPDDAQLPVRKLAERAGVSHETARQALRDLNHRT